MDSTRFGGIPKLLVRSLKGEFYGFKSCFFFNPKKQEKKKLMCFSYVECTKYNKITKNRSLSSAGSKGGVSGNIDLTDFLYNVAALQT